MIPRKFFGVYWKCLFWGSALVVAFGFQPCWAKSIVDSKHNLSSSGPGMVVGPQEREICIFCHIPHNASIEAPLWSRYDRGQKYIPYSSSTSKAVIGQPTGASKLCLSCHDGTVALGMIRSRANVIQFSAQIRKEKNIGIDLSDDHPVSFRYDASLVSRNPQLKDPLTLTGPVRLDHTSQVQCTSCHDPHNDEYGNFLVMGGTGSGLCIQCHDNKGWISSSHHTSQKSFHGIPGIFENSKWNTVEQYGCEGCHRPHNAGKRERLLFYSEEEKNCLLCHNGSVASMNMSVEFNKFSAHPISRYTGVHDPSEPALVFMSSRHVECNDCHNPHAVSENVGSKLPGSLRFVKGINASGAEVNPIDHEYELCFRCHADTNIITHPYVNRQYPEANIRFEFDPSNQSFHPIETIGRNSDVPSLISPLTTASLMTCSSCHNNDAESPNLSRNPKGPHGSMYAPILERNLSFADNQPESINTYALCYKCHDRNSILSDESFPKHREHILEIKAPCSACHDPHGVKNNSHLINFDRNIVDPDSSGRLMFEDSGRFSGRCYLTCHKEEHSPEKY